jgi:hypothetical protein
VIAFWHSGRMLAPVRGWPLIGQVITNVTLVLHAAHSVHEPAHPCGCSIAFQAALPMHFTGSSRCLVAAGAYFLLAMAALAGAIYYLLPVGGELA